MDAEAYRQARIALVAAIGRLSELDAVAPSQRPTGDVLQAAQADVDAATHTVRLLEAEMLREDRS